MSPSQILQAGSLDSPKRKIQARSSHTPIRRKDTFYEIDLTEQLSKSPNTQLFHIQNELDYQGEVLSRVVRDIHLHHEVRTGFSTEYFVSKQRFSLL